MLSHCSCCSALSCTISLFSLGRLSYVSVFTSRTTACFYALMGAEKCLCCVCLSLFCSVCLSLITSVCMSPSECMCAWVALWGRKVFMLHQASICLSCNNLFASLLATIRPPMTLSHSLVRAAKGSGWELIDDFCIWRPSMKVESRGTARKDRKGTLKGKWKEDNRHTEMTNPYHVLGNVRHWCLSRFIHCAVSSRAWFRRNDLVWSNTTSNIDTSPKKL